MSNNSEYNKITSTIDSITRDFTYSPDSNNLICIDTSNSRIGINTLDPLYSLHISGGDIFNTSLTVREISNVSLKFIINDISTKLDNLLTGLINRNPTPEPPVDFNSRSFSSNNGSGYIRWGPNPYNIGNKTITGYIITYDSVDYMLGPDIVSFYISVSSRTTITIVAYNDYGSNPSIRYLSNSQSISVTQL